MSDFWLRIDFPECSSLLSHKGQHQVTKYGQKKTSKGREPQARSPEDTQRVLGTAGSCGGFWDGRVAGSQVSSGENLRKEGSD